MKKFFIFFILFSILIVLVISIYSSQTINSFSLKEYEYEISNFPSTISYRTEIDAAKAKKIAQSLWEENYPNSYYTKPYRVAYDAEKQVWLVSSSFLYIIPSGPYLIITEETGNVLALWHEKF